MFKKYKYFALATLCAAALAGCDKAGSFFGADKKEASFVERIEHTKDDGSVSMLLPDFAQLVQSEGPAVVNIQAAPAPSTENGGRSAENDSDPASSSAKTAIF